MTALLTIDFESTALEVATLTALEVAWCVTDISGEQRLPLRHRYCQITNANRALVPREHNVNDMFWDRNGGGDPAALKMAEESGLFDDWLASDPRTRLTTGAELQRLLLDDITEVTDPDVGGVPEYVHIHGAGAARFDFSLLELHCRGVLPRFGDRYPTHYRPVDTSGVQTGLLGNNYEQDMIQWAQRTYGKQIGEIEVGRPPDYNFGPRPLDGARHRAPVDVARAIVLQRALWRYAEPLRTEILCAVAEPRR